MWLVLIWLISFFFLLALMLLLGFQLVCLIDLEFDYVNPYDSASRINMVLLPELITQGVLCFLYLVTGHWIMLLLFLPYLYYSVNRYVRGQCHIDVTEIYRQVKPEKKIRIFKLAYLIIFFIFTLVWLLISLGDDDDWQTNAQ